MWQQLIANFAVVGLFISAWSHLQHRLQRYTRARRNYAFGIVMGLGVVASMALTVEFRPGMFFDLRSSLVALSGFFGGPVAALITGSIAAAFRLSLGGGGTTSGIISIAISSLIGVAGWSLLRGRQPSSYQPLIFAVATSATSVLGFLALPAETRGAVFNEIAPTLMLLNFFTTCSAGYLFVYAHLKAHERNMLLTALRQAPDFLYVKDVQSRFVAVNHTVATANGFADPAAMNGMSDFQITPEERAKTLFDREQDLMKSGKTILDFEEKLVDEGGHEKWFSTSKAPLYNTDGEVIGLVGVSRETSYRKNLEKELVDSRDLLTFVLTEISDGLALFEQDGTLLFCNEQYRELFPRTKELRVPGAMLADILRAVNERGEQLGIPPDGVEGWIDGILTSLREGADDEVQLFNDSWLSVRTKPVKGNRATVIISDISSIKHAELELRGLTEQLKLLARTDGLTGLLNRRAFDEMLESEMVRAQRSSEPISLIMIDIDRFKAFNDIYGHPAGDACLRRVAQAVQLAVRRSTDYVARYGGEEMCVVLPSTDEDGAFHIAEQMRRAVREMGLTHDGSEKGLVTISLGVASYAQGTIERSASELLSRADKALYVAKDSGRDSVSGWSAKNSPRLTANADKQIPIAT